MQEGVSVVKELSGWCPEAGNWLYSTGTGLIGEVAGRMG